MGLAAADQPQFPQLGSPLRPLTGLSPLFHIIQICQDLQAGAVFGALLLSWARLRAALSGGSRAGCAERRRRRRQRRAAARPAHNALQAHREVAVAAVRDTLFVEKIILHRAQQQQQQQQQGGSGQAGLGGSCFLSPFLSHSGPRTPAMGATGWEGKQACRM